MSPGWFVRSLCLVLLTGFLPSSVWGQASFPLSSTPSLLKTPQLRALSPGLVQAYSRVLLKQATLRPFTSLKPPVMAALLKVKRPLTNSEIQRLETAGVAFRKLSKGLLHFRNFYPIRITSPSTLQFLNTFPLVSSVVPDRGLNNGLHAPLSHTAKGIEVTALRKTLSDKNIPIRGKGVLVGLLDSGINVFHPLFFRADGGLFSWIDVDGDKVYTPCKDAVDLNKNGKADENETLCCLQGRIYNSIRDPIDIDRIPGTCRAGVDWLYADKNKDNRRNYGPSEGFKESDPTYGEPLFVIDDVNGNKKLDIGEKLVALKTSKIRATLVKGVERTRGKDLILTTLSKDPADAIDHGTGSASVLVGGQPGYSQFTGMAPDAEIIVASTRSYQKGAGFVTGTAEGLTWLHQQKALVVLHEYATWFGEFLDGSSAHEQLIDKMGKEGYIQVTPTGNLGGSQKHLKYTLAKKTKWSTKIHVQLPAHYPDGYPNYRSMTITMLWRDPQNKNLPANLQFFLTPPGGKRIRLTPTPTRGKFLFTNVFAYVVRKVSSRGTAMLDLKLYGYQGQTPIELPKGDWLLEVENDDDKEAVLHGYLSDQISSWGVGVKWLEHTTNDGLAGWPSTSDTSIGVGAHVGHGDFPYNFNRREKEGDLRGYSSGGPRIDGLPLVWVTAPDNPVVANSPQTRGGQPWVEFGQYRVFGGTSGASPHVAGAIALMKQLHPFWRQEKVKEVLKKSALMDAGIPKDQLPHKRWGYGKLRIYQALFDKKPPLNRPPQILLDGPQTFVLGNLPKEIFVKLTDPEDPPDSLKLQWDVGYKGVWSTPAKVSAVPFPLTKVGKIQVKLRVVDPKNETSSVLLNLEVKACQKTSECQDGFLCQKGTCAPKPKPEPSNPDAGGDNKPGNVGCGCQTTLPPGTPFLVSLFFLVLLRRKRFR